MSTSLKRILHNLTESLTFHQLLPFTTVVMFFQVFVCPWREVYTRKADTPRQASPWADPPPPPPPRDGHCSGCYAFYRNAFLLGFLSISTLHTLCKCLNNYPKSSKIFYSLSRQNEIHHACAGLVLKCARF